MKATAEELRSLRYGALLSGERSELLMVLGSSPLFAREIDCIVLRCDRSPTSLYWPAYQVGELFAIQTNWDYEIVSTGVEE